MAKIITIAHQKGGVGKSTLALNLAYAVSGQAKTAIADLDPQGTISMLKANGSIGEVVGVLPGAFKISALSSLDEYDIVFIDTPPYNNADLPALLAVSDVVIIPTKAGVPDVLAISATIGFVRLAQQKKPALKAGIVINMVKPRTGLAEEAREYLEQYGVPVLAEIKDRVSYVKSVVAGGVVAGKDAQAISEINSLVNEILELL